MPIRIMSDKTVLTTFERGENGAWSEVGVSTSADYKRYTDRVFPALERYNRQVIDGAPQGAKPTEKVGNWGHELGPRFQVHLVNDRPSGILMNPTLSPDERDPLQLEAMRKIVGLPADSEVVERWVYEFPGFTVRHEVIAPILDKLESAGLDRISVDGLRSIV